MDPVNGLGQIVQVLRKKLADTSTSAPIKSNTSRKSTGTKSTQKKSSPEEIKKKIGELIQAIPESDYTDAKATTVFVEVIVTWELGDEILQDPKFGELTREVAKLITGNRELQEKMSQIIKQL